MFKKFFISMVLPYSVVRGETFELKIAVYNYADTDTDVSVALQQNLQGFVIESEAAHTMRASAGGPTVVSFVVRPLVVGNTLITASGSSPTQQDTVVRSLLVKPEGIRREYVSSTLIDIDESGEVRFNLLLFLCLLLLLLFVLSLIITVCLTPFDTLWWV